MEETTSEQQVPSEISFVQSLEFNDRCLSDWQIHALLEHGAIPAELDVHKTAVGRLEGVGRDPKQPDNKDLDLDNKDLEDKGLDLACRTINRGSRGIGLRKKSPGATRRQETSQPAPGHCKGDSRETAIKEGAEDIVAAGRGWGCHTWDRLLRQLESEGRLPFRVDVEGLGPKTVDRQSCLAALDFRGDGLPYPPYEIQVLWEEMGAGYPSAASFLYTVPYKFNRYIDLYFYWHYLYDAGMPCSFYTWLRLEDAEPQTPVKRTSIVSPSLLSKEQLSTARAIYRKTYGQIKPLFAIHVWEAFNLLGESAEEAVGVISVEIKRVVGIPEAYKDQGLMIKAEYGDFLGSTHAATPDYEDGRLAVTWSIAFDFPYKKLADAEDQDVRFELLALEEEYLASAGLEIEHAIQLGQYESVQRLPLTARGTRFRGSFLEIAMKFVEAPCHAPKHMDMRVEKAQKLLIDGEEADPSDEFYVTLHKGEGETRLGMTPPASGVEPEWHHHIKAPYEGERMLVLHCFRKSKVEGVPDLHIGEAALDVWGILREPSVDGEWMKPGGLIISSGGSHTESPRGKISLTIRLWDDQPGTMKMLKTGTNLGAMQNDGDRDGAGHGDQHGANNDVLDPSKARSLANDAKKLADQAASDAQRANNAASDADLAARMHPSNRELDDLANEADEAAKDAEKAAKLAERLADEADELAHSHRPPKAAMQDVLDSLKKKADDARRSREKAEEAAKQGLQLSADELANQARAHAQKAGDYATQTGRIADSHKDVAKLAQLASGARGDHATGLQAARDARKEAKNCAEACANADKKGRRRDDPLTEAYNAMKAAEQANKDAAEMEEEAHLKWKKAKKLAQKRLVEMEREQEDELKRKQKQIEVEAEAKARLREEKAEQDRLNRQRSSLVPGESDAYNLAQGSRLYKPPQSPEAVKFNQGGVFRNCCNWGNPRTNPEYPSSDVSKEYVVGATGTSAAVVLDAEKYGLPETTGYTVEGPLLYSGRKTPWCWCFGCQCCQCCGEC
ncbi:hypothetical protein GNI_020530 [Gregarina niphandrodes]|uniref:C2 domain-containing protein n=1 Tax=Gregarina niphandrodes TaxID=110365 RepID=A0A023BBS7_GRENI|nr:hypothetical protein GNI_020530 [Gregarina niphandrodes]EZG80923.1 hypothetical protein GNI_020530 [Gregarina niphandrodes]|eukprot:XP_011134281.1 hypothetical protein GNI_020530 [Gregarina niphandrodes]